MAQAVSYATAYDLHG